MTAERDGPAAPKSVRFAGYASVFDRLDRGNDVVRRGAFAASLSRKGPVPLLWQHRGDAPIGHIETLEEDQRGLRVVGCVTHPAAAALVKRGALSGLSFGYRVEQARGGERGGARGAPLRGADVRELIVLDLAEVSLVAQPMQPLARVIAVDFNEE